MAGIGEEVAFGEAQAKETIRLRSARKTEVCGLIASVDCVCIAGSRRLNEQGAHGWCREGSVSVVRQRGAGWKVLEHGEHAKNSVKALSFFVAVMRSIRGNITFCLPKSRQRDRHRVKK